MLGLAPGFGCQQGNVTCYCTEPNFGYGVRDCANEACPNASDAATVIAFGTQYCQRALSSIASTASMTPSLSAIGVLSSASGNAGSSASMTGSSGSASMTGTAAAGAGAGSASSTATIT